MPKKSSEERYEIARHNAVYFLRIEALIVALLAVYLLIAALFSKITNVSAWVGEIIFGFLGAGALYVCSVGFKRRKSYGRAPAVLANLIALGVSYFMFSGGLIAVAIPLAILALITLFSALFGYKDQSGAIL